jgi:hypothetical protein
VRSASQVKNVKVKNPAQERRRGEKVSSERSRHVGEREDTYAIDDEQLAVHVLASVACEENDGSCEILGVTPAACRDAL